MKVAVLAGGTGGAKLLAGLALAEDPSNVTAIVNTGDDDVIYDVVVCPDVDMVTYWLAGIADASRGWGIRDDTFNIVDGLARLGAPAWFRLGDLDFATCLFRGRRMAAGATLTAVTDEIRRRLGVGPRVLPMSDDPVRTRIVTHDGRILSFQEYFVKERQAPEVKSVHFDGVEDAKPAPGVLEAIEESDRVILSPSNPIVSIGPILAVGGIGDAVREHHDVVAVSPIIRGVALKGPADKMLGSTGAEASATGVAMLYRDLADTFVIDSTERPTERARIEALGMHIRVLDTIMRDPDASRRIATELLSS